jgi:mevalonate kinase
MFDQRSTTDDREPLDDDAPRSPLVSNRASASAPAKLILCGEHAVVYARPAIALPLAGIRARADVAAGRTGAGIVVYARDLGRRWRVAEGSDHPISELIASVLAKLGRPLDRTLDLKISIRSTIPIASGMGSGAAVATALVRALAAYFGRQLAPAEISALVYASERRFHGTPSGIDNTVIAYERPIWFLRRGVGSWEAGGGPEAHQPPTPNSQLPAIEPIAIAAPFTLVVADTGVRSPTRAPVGEVRRRWQAEPARYEAWFEQIGALALRVRAALADGDVAALRPLLTENHALLQQIGVSSPELDALVVAALEAGALGAKLSGAGWGGVMLALVASEASEPVVRALKEAGAKRVLETLVEPTLAGSAGEDTL